MNSKKNGIVALFSLMIVGIVGLMIFIFTKCGEVIDPIPTIPETSTGTTISTALETETTSKETVTTTTVSTTSTTTGTITETVSITAKETTVLTETKAVCTTKPITTKEEVISIPYSIIVITDPPATTSPAIETTVYTTAVPFITAPTITDAPTVPHNRKLLKVFPKGTYYCYEKTGVKGGSGRTLIDCSIGENTGDKVIKGSIPINGLKIVTVWKQEDTYGRQFLCSQFSYLCDHYNGRNTWDLYKVINERTLSRAYLNDTIYGKHFVDFELSNNSLNITLVDMWKKAENTFCITGSQWDVKPKECFDMNNPFAILYDGTLGHSRIIDLSDPVKISDYYGQSTNHDGKIKCIVCPSNFRKLAELDVDQFLLNVVGIQLKRNANYNLPLRDAFNDLMSGQAIMFDGDDYYFALRDDKSICVYDKNTNREEWTITNFVLAFGNKASKYILSDRWMSFDNPLKSNQKGDEQDE